jgi:hypothetical protein
MSLDDLGTPGSGSTPVMPTSANLAGANRWNRMYRHCDGRAGGHGGARARPQSDPIVLSHARALLTSTTAPTSYIDADARDTAKILAEAAQLLDLGQPTGMMLIAVLHCIPAEDDPYRLVSDLIDAVPPGSFLAITHPARDQLAIATRAEESLTKSMRQKVTFRTHEQVSRFFGGLDLVDPGVVPIQEWHADSILDINSPPTAMRGGVARKA